MKHSFSGFSLAEIIVGVTILVMTAGSIVLSFSFLMDRELETKIALQNIYFHSYVWDLLHTWEIPELNVGNTFYFTHWGNSFDISLDPRDAWERLWFFDEDITQNFHEITVIDTKEIHDISYTIYQVKTSLFANEKISYIMK